MNEKLKVMSICGSVAFAPTALEQACNKENISSNEVDFLMDRIWEFTNSMALDHWKRMINELMPVCILDPK